MKEEKKEEEKEEKRNDEEKRYLSHGRESMFSFTLAMSIYGLLIMQLVRVEIESKEPYFYTFNARVSCIV